MTSLFKQAVVQATEVILSDTVVITDAQINSYLTKELYQSVYNIISAEILTHDVAQRSQLKTQLRATFDPKLVPTVTKPTAEQESISDVLTKLAATQFNSSKLQTWTHIKRCLAYAIYICSQTQSEFTKTKLSGSLIARFTQLHASAKEAQLKTKEAKEPQATPTPSPEGMETTPTPSPATPAVEVSEQDLIILETVSQVLTTMTPFISTGSMNGWFHFLN